ncbi:MAG: prepilin-type N-terminal cleavage/methylation domain-containing protein [Candidatus Pacebacteria bacterium]|nr:prepilin-type N-terminal cleavage/methylation domain-containing protein [Candidatus Paceibacterota bacterium]
MKKGAHMTKNILQTAKQAGFTMIELLIVISILGILAVAVLSAINPIEQINRGRDTGSQSDAEQLLSAIDRYNAFQGYYPWQLDADVADTGVYASMYDATANDVPVAVSSTTPCVDGDSDTACSTATADCAIIDRLSQGDTGVTAISCTGAQEIKQSFANRLVDAGTRTLYVYNRGTSGDSTYVCFIPQSGAFRTEAINRCASVDGDVGAGLPSDVSDIAAAYICGDQENAGYAAIDTDLIMHCIP